MKKYSESFYDRLNDILLRYPTIRWISKENDSVLCSEKIEAVDLSYFTVLLKFPFDLLGDPATDSIRARVELRQAKYYAGNVLSWQQLFMLFNDQTPLLFLREKTRMGTIYRQYILVQHGMRFIGIKTIVIDNEAKN